MRLRSPSSTWTPGSRWNRWRIAVRARLPLSPRHHATWSTATSTRWFLFWSDVGTDGWDCVFTWSRRASVATRLVGTSLFPVSQWMAKWTQVAPGTCTHCRLPLALSIDGPAVWGQSGPARALPAASVLSGRTAGGRLGQSSRPGDFAESSGWPVQNDLSLSPLQS